MSWDIDEKSGHCRSESGTEVILSTDRIGPYRPALGPFSVSRNTKQIALDVVSLTNAVERTSYLLWGSLSSAQTNLAKITFMGHLEHWIPDPSARTHWCIEAGAWELAAAEWSMNPAGDFQHLAGVAFTLPKGVQKSFRMFNPIKHRKTSEFIQDAWPATEFEEAVHSLGNVALRLNSSKKNEVLLPQPVF